MSKQANKTLVGIFVVGAVVLVIVSLLVFGSGVFFTKTSKFVMYFGGSVKGLNVGAPVMFRGVRIGHVTDIMLRFDPRDLSILIPVYIEINPGRLTVPEGARLLVKKAKKDDFMEDLVVKGLKAQLQMQSFVTGQLMINMDFYPDKPIKLVGVEKRYLEIPTTPSGFEELSLTLEDTVKQVNKTLASVQFTIQSNAKLGHDMNSAIQELNRAARSLRILSDYLERHPEALIRGKSDSE